MKGKLRRRLVAVHDIRSLHLAIVIKSAARFTSFGIKSGGEMDGHALTHEKRATESIIYEASQRNAAS